MSRNRCVAFILSAMLAVPFQLPAQEAGGLKIVVLQGEGARNSIRARTATAPAVEVRDAADKPVAGAQVVFQLPITGPSGVFNGWVRTQTVRTNEQGQAAASGYTPNEEEGRFNIKVVATHGTQSASAVIAQSNIIGAGNGSAASSRKSGWWKVLAVVGAGGLAGGIIAATRNGDSTAAAIANPVVITSGPVTIGGPR